MTGHRSTCILLTLLACLSLGGLSCGEGGKEYATNLGEAIDRGKANGARGDMEAMAAALTSYSVQEADLPEVSDIHALADLLQPQYIRFLKKTDPWGTEYEFESGSSGYEVRSAGQDREFGTKDDIVMEDGQMTQMPAGITRL